jgi:ADP-ribose pyrophosphatase YjhB (NUDIX family)
MLVWHARKLLLIERQKFPFGFAPPAGHVDERISYEAAAEAELLEEVGLHATRRELVAEGRKNNPCRRIGGTWHYWKIYQIEITNTDLALSAREVKCAKWCSVHELKKLATRTEQRSKGMITDAEWKLGPGLEQVWYEWFKQLHIV